MASKKTIKPISAFFAKSNEVEMLNETETQKNTSNDKQSNDDTQNESKPSIVREFRQVWLSTFTWLRYDRETNRMYCDFCRRASPTLARKTDFVDGKFKRENVLAHSKSLRHGKCRDFIINKTSKQSIENSRIAKKFLAAEIKSNEKDLSDLKVKFNTVYCIGKEEIAFTKLKHQLLLQYKNGLPVTPAYSNDVRCGEMMSTSSSTIRDETLESISDFHYVSVMIDGATDSSVSENEAVYVRTVLNAKQKINLLK